jgi:hypothetical protein
VRIYTTPNFDKPFRINPVLSGVLQTTFSLPYNSQYRVTVETKGTGNFSNSPESGKYSFDTNLKAVITNQPTGAVSGAALTTQPVVKIVYPSGNIVMGFNGNVVASIASGSGTLNGTKTKAAASGIATFTNLAITGTAGNFTLTFAPVGASAVTSNSFVLTAGAAVTIAITAGNSQSAVAGQAVTTAPSVIVKDANNNPVSGVSVTFAVATGGGSITGATPTTNSSGIATLGSWTLGTVAGSNTLTATSGSLTNSPLTFTATGTAGAASALTSTVSVSPTSITADGTTTATIAVQLKDANSNNLTTGGATVTFANPSTGTIGTTTDNTNGTYSATYTASTTPGSVTITPKLSATTFTSTSSITLTASSPSTPVCGSNGMRTSGGSGPCQVGDIGPGGGIIYYYDSVGFNCGAGFTTTGSPTGGLCNYLEVAPSGWNTGTDPVKVWAVSAFQSKDVSGITNESVPNNSSTGIGLGYKNSDLIVTQNGSTYNESTNNYAAGAARAYAGGTLSDWYLPTTDELNLLCQWNRNFTQDVTVACTGGEINTGRGASGSGFGAEFYWSSSEYDAVKAWYQYFPHGTQIGSSKGDTPSVRPIRAFGSSYAIGATGPGGGIIYYYDSVGFKCGAGFTIDGSPTVGLCHYLEVAPDGWNTGADPVKVWAVSAFQGADVSGITNDSSAYNDALGIGLGYKNSDLIVTQNGDYVEGSNDYAAGAARAYAGGSKNDWYLPTTAELNLLCQWDRGVAPSVTTACSGGSLNSSTYGATSAGFVANYYWSSSEYGTNHKWFQFFSDGGQDEIGANGNAGYVRPVRAF